MCQFAKMLGVPSLESVNLGVVYIFPDTNIFIHGRHFEEIDWPVLVGSANITLMLAPSVITELDKHKYNPAKKVAQRAKKLLPKVEAIILNPANCKWNVTAIPRRPSTEFLEQHHLDSKDQDDVLLATILEFKETIGKGDHAILITNDTGPRLKAVSLKITAQSLPDDYLMPDEPDESEKKLALLQKELEQYRNKIPLVSLEFENGNNYLEIEKPYIPKSQEEFVNGKMQEIWKEFSPLVFQEDNSVMLPGGKRMIYPLAFSVVKAQVDLYNEELKDFFTQYEEYFVKEYQRAYFLLNCCPVSIQIKNTGTVPAQDIDIFMHFPDGFDIIEEDDIPETGKKPSPPHKPKHAFDLQVPSFSLGELTSRLHPVQHRADLSHFNTNVGSPSIKKTNSYDVNVHVRSVKHNQSEQLDKLWLKYDDMRNAKGFTVDYRIMAANITQVVAGKLNVNFIDNKD